MSRLGEGSTFTLYLPHTYPLPASASAAAPQELPVRGGEIERVSGMPALGSGRLEALFLHRRQASLPEATRQMLEKFQQTDLVLAGKKVLVVDDDMRNIFALTSMLERHHMQVVYAENGRDGIALLQNTPDIDIVLMDVMMPEMDGYETMRAIRKIGKFRSLPMIALTAKAMQGDREKCLEAGASDYIPKPVDTEQLLSLLRVWLYQ